MPEYWKDINPFVHEEEVKGITLKTYRERPRNLNETLSESVDKFPEKTAFVHGNERITYKQLQEQVNNAAYQLRRKYGVNKGDRVAFLLMNGIPFVVGVYAALQIGAIAVPLNTKLKSTELSFMLKNSGAKVVVSNLEWWPNIESILTDTHVESVFITDETPPDGTLPYSRLIEPAEENIQEKVDEHDYAFIMYTSGTTGRPKGALITHFNMIHTALNYKYCYNLSSNDSTVIAVPVFHITGLAAQLMTFVLLGGKTVLMPMFKSTQFLEILQDEQITHVIASPTVYVMTLLDPAHKNYDVSKFRVGAFGGAPMPSETLRALKNWVPNIELHNTYGLTETTSPAVIMPNEYQLNHVRSVGVPTPVTEAKIVDPETRAERKPGEVGELLFKGPMVIQKYWNNEEATKKAITGGWLATGDLAAIDEEGFVTIMDRIKDMVNRGGEKIFSVEVEDVLYANPKVMEAAIVGVPDDKYGEVVKACIVPRNGEMLTEEEVKNWVKDRLAKYKVPTYVEFLTILPRNPNGKVVKTELRYVPEVSKN
ncbi:class I adenylate-forming enzyme family protein [Salirhabdus sp. Marseille-P4669]|uniref:class I adenylate-forming enzyme family protein n=1 Tax=Salirhabdus sp. Marseille-P4669 TaxID=2042310 RepID=UPI000C7CC83A|nr:class I adenylate-forming enzyme family protein [Salirhabdus sp. Marseille-P4669]